jgi:hypothetical protein
MEFIKIGSFVKIICKNGFVDAGKVLELSDNQLVLELSDKSISIILQPKENIVNIKVASDKILQEIEKPIYVENLDIPEIEHIPFQREDLRAKKLSELHKLKANEERKRAEKLLRSNKLSIAPEVIFGTPNFTKSFSQHPKKKTR